MKRRREQESFENNMLSLDAESYRLSRKWYDDWYSRQ